MIINPPPAAQYVTQPGQAVVVSSHGKPLSNTRHLRINTEHVPASPNFPINYTQTTSHKAQPVISFNINTPQHLKRSHHFPPSQPSYPVNQQVHYQTSMKQSQHLGSNVEMRQSQHESSSSEMRRSQHLPREHLMRQSHNLAPAHLETQPAVVPRVLHHVSANPGRLVHPQYNGVPPPAGSVVIRQSAQPQQQITRPHIIIGSQSPSNAIVTKNRPVTHSFNSQESHPPPPKAVSQDIIIYDPPQTHSASQEIVIVEAP